jgi:sugar phosphate isomerase/epimerase
VSWPARLSVNDALAYPRSLSEFVEAAKNAGVTGIGLHIHQVEAIGVEGAAKLIKDSGIAVSNYSAVGYWASGVDYAGKPRTLEDTIRNLDEAVELGTEVVGVMGGLLADGDKDLAAARARVVKGIAELVPHAKQRNLKLAIEPVHPIFGGNGLPIPTLHHALDIIDEVGGDPCLGLLLDTYHVWWEPDLAEQLRRAGTRVFVIQICDWVPAWVTTNIRSRAMLGEGCIDFNVFLDNLPDFNGWFDHEGRNWDRLSKVPLPELLDLVSRTSSEVLGSRLG